ncbi:MAG TPA: HAD family hydrolase [Candidatus Cybelea sp.]|nr:HAD family hydrolase [Candidatus Cybelea sp.]
MPRPCAVLFDRDETIVVDVPFNGDPERVEPAPDARALLDRLRAAGLPLAVVSNQSGIGRGLLTREAVDAVNRRVEELLGPFAGFFVCPHAPDAGCDCRKPKPKLILDAARALGVKPACCIVVGDRASDVEAARNAGAIALRVEGPQGLAAAVERILYWVEASSQ